ncbi:hypothetical protein [Streptomyces sp. NPDC001927]
MTDWPTAEARRRPARVSSHRPTAHPARRASDRLFSVVRHCRTAPRVPRPAARRRRSRTVRARAAHKRRSGGSQGSDPADHPGHSGHPSPSVRSRPTGHSDRPGRQPDASPAYAYAHAPIRRTTPRRPARRAPEGGEA